MPRRTTAKKKELFLEAQERAVSVLESAKHAGVSRGTPYEWEQSDEQFNSHWSRVQVIRKEMVEDSAYDNALEGDSFMQRFLINREDRRAAKEPIETIGEIMIIEPSSGEPDGPHEFVTLEYGDPEDPDDSDEEEESYSPIIDVELTP